MLCYAPALDDRNAREAELQYGGITCDEPPTLDLGRAATALTTEKRQNFELLQVEKRMFLQALSETNTTHARALMASGMARQPLLHPRAPLL